jgi:hypothetical protein
MIGSYPILDGIINFVKIIFFAAINGCWAAQPRYYC